jgi:hypothetical protein
MSVNDKLLKKQGVENNLELILELHKIRSQIFDTMAATTNMTVARMLDRLCQEIEFELQDAWKFPRDARHHRFWLRPHCTCPQMDNAERAGTGYCIISNDCPLHRWEGLCSTSESN